MKFKEVLEKNDAELTAELVEKAKTLSTLRTQATIQKLENNSLIGKTRKDVARIKTALKQRQLAAAPVAKAPSVVVPPAAPVKAAAKKKVAKAPAKATAAAK